ncbi:PREDICTED: 14 [Prunus dulcis]|uniref:PREDICTED: 14 n=1 Tax=Prunus dulcis TaxID=3755 RepID=A0A5E4G3B8_PRUDU|nr:PREDICTED: 14 [Prunus dulcis]
MASSMAIATIALLLSLNLVFFTTVSSNHHVPNCPPPPKTPKHPPPPTPIPPAKASCPKDTLKLGVCGDLLNGLVHLVVGTQPKTPCCSLIGGLADVEAASP